MKQARLSANKLALQSRSTLRLHVIIDNGKGRLVYGERSFCSLAWRLFWRLFSSTAHPGYRFKGVLRRRRNTRARLGLGVVCFQQALKQRNNFLAER